MNTQPLPSAPQLGAQVPGTTGGLPALSGLSVTKNPMAQQLQSMGRGEDSMLIHMTPNEVNSLQGLAMAHGGSLTINPHTGLPEAGWLGKLLPTILGIAGAAVGIPTWAIGLGGAGIGTAVTGDLGKGLMIGLGAYGGAGLGNAVGLGGKISENAFGLLGDKAANVVPGVGANAVNAATPPVTPPVTPPAPTPAITPPAAPTGTGLAQGLTEAQTNQILMGQPGAPFDLVPEAMGGTATAATYAPVADIGGEVVKNTAAKPGFLGAFKNATNIAGTGNLGAIGGGLGVLSNISEATAPKLPTMPEEEKYNYEGPYVPTDRPVSMPTTSARERGGAEHMFFPDSNPVPGYKPYKNTMGFAEGGPVRPQGERDFGFRPAVAPPSAVSNPATGGITGKVQAMQNLRDRQGISMGGGGIKGPARQLGASAPPPASAFARVVGPARRGGERDFGFRPAAAAMAHGGEVALADGAFVLDARTVSEIGNGSSNAGKEILRRIGGHPVEGPGDGVSDSVPARIGKDQPARVARDEVVVPAQAVKKLGKGNPKRGADKLYALMDKAHKARKKAKRGQDTGLRKGLA